MNDQFEDLVSLNEDRIDALEDVLAEVKRWNPPEELQEFHRFRVRSSDAILEALKDTGLLELMQELEEASEEEDQAKVLSLSAEISELENEMSGLEDDLAEMEDEIERTKEDLSPATRQILADAGCL